MKPAGLLLILASLFPAQAAKSKEIEEFKRRCVVSIEGADRVKVTADGTCLYAGPGKNARVEVETNARLSGQVFVSVRVEGEEVARFWVKSLAKPIGFPPTLVLDPESLGFSSSSQATNGKATCTISTTDGRGSTAKVYEGPGQEIEPEVRGKAPRRWYSVRVDGELVYYAPASTGETVRKVLGGLVEGKDPQDTKEHAPAIEEPLRESVARVLKRLNEFRVGAGLPPVEEDPKLSEGCQLHAEYLCQNPEEYDGPKGHSENVLLPGYSAKGKESAKRSVINSANLSAELHIDIFIATLYHRLSLLRPRIGKVGIGIANSQRNGRSVVIDCGSFDIGQVELVRPVIFPSDGQKDVPLAFSLGGGEYPDPRPDKSKPAGYPITVTCAPPGWSPGQASATLSLESESVPCWVFCRENEALVDHPIPETICILPKEPLRPKATYLVSLKCKQYGIEKTPEWSKTWTFTTGAGVGEIKK